MADTLQKRVLPGPKVLWVFETSGGYMSYLH